MHASLPELLSLRDAEPVDARIAQHVSACTLCTRELERLSGVREQLQRMPQLDAPEQSWSQIQERIRLEPTRRPRWMSAAAGVAALVVVASALLTRQPEQMARETPTESPASAPAPVDQLVARSQELEELLQALPDRPLIERVSTAATLDTIEQRIQWLDYQLSYAPEGTLDERQAERLWRERVELMDSMVKVRYAEAGRLSF